MSAPLFAVAVCSWCSVPADAERGPLAAADDGYGRVDWHAGCVAEARAADPVGAGLANAKKGRA